jgi:predicted alpha/beta-hydrolase family hydrolase
MQAPDFLVTDVERPVARLLLAHGAGAAMDSAFMELMAELLAARRISVVRFEFPYMAARRTGTAKRPAPKAETLMDCFRESAAATPGTAPLLIGGKSMGGRVASMIADEAFGAGSIKGLVCLGYPFHPPNRPETMRTAHLLTLVCPALIVQGERDPFGTRGEIEALTLSPAIAFEWLGDGDHDFGPRGASGFTRKGNLTAAADAVAAFVARVVN